MTEDSTRNSLLIINSEVESEAIEAEVVVNILSLTTRFHFPPQTTKLSAVSDRFYFVVFFPLKPTSFTSPNLTV